MSYGILSKNAFVLGGYVLGDFAIGDSVLDSRDYRQTNTIDLTKMYFYAVHLTAVLFPPVNVLYMVGVQINILH